MDDVQRSVALPVFRVSLLGAVLGLTAEYFVGPGSFWGIGPWIGALGITGTVLSGIALRGKRKP